MARGSPEGLSRLKEAWAAWGCHPGCHPKPKIGFQSKNGFQINRSSGVHHIFLVFFGDFLKFLVLKMRQLLASAACEPWSVAFWSQLGCFLSSLRPESDMLGQRMPGERQPTRQLRRLRNDSIRATGNGLKKGGWVSSCPRCWV